MTSGAQEAIEKLLALRADLFQFVAEDPEDEDDEVAREVLQAPIDAIIALLQGGRA